MYFVKVSSSLYAQTFKLLKFKGSDESVDVIRFDVRGCNSILCAKGDELAITRVQFTIRVEVNCALVIANLSPLPLTIFYIRGEKFKRPVFLHKI